MATRQYIGARYTPKFSGTYDATQAYEALEVVDNGSGTTYIARKPVPPNTPLTDTTYWLVYGSSSGAILDLQERVGEIEEDIPVINSSILSIGGQVDALENTVSTLDDDVKELKDDVKYGSILFIFDSYGTDAGNAEGDTTTIPGTMHSISDLDFDYIASSGSGFVRDVGGGTFRDRLVTYCASHDMSKFKHVYVAAGRNDWTANKSTLKSAVSSFCEYAQDHIPNLETIRFAYIANGDNNSTHGTKADQKICHQNFYEICQELSYIEWVPNVDCVLHDYSLLAVDGVHPTSAGKVKLAEALIQSIKGEFTCQGEIKTINITALSGYSIGQEGEMTAEVMNNDTIIRPGTYMLVTLPSPITGSSGNYHAVFASISSNSYIKHPYTHAALPYIVCRYENSRYYPITGYVRVNPTGELEVFLNLQNSSVGINSLVLIGNGLETIPANYT